MTFRYSKILTIAACVLYGFCAAEDVLLTKGERLDGAVSGGGGSWQVAANKYRAAEVLLVRFSQEAPPARVPAGVFIRGGSMLTGTLVSIIGDTAEISSTALGNLKIKRDDITGAFSPLASGQTENMPEVARYSSLLAATLGTHGSILQPGQRCRVRFAGLDEINAERLMRVGSEQILLSSKNKAVETISRQFVRLLEINAPPAPAASPEDLKLGPEVIVRLKGGDLIRGRVTKLDDKGLTLHTVFMGDKVLDRGTLAVLFLAGGTDSGVTWLSSQKPAKSVHTPLFDSEFPAKLDSTIDGNDMNIKGFVCERGIGVHSRSELEFTLSGAPQRFIAVCGMDAETRGRGQVSARVSADGKEVWKEDTIASKDGPKIVAADLGPAKSVTLFVDFGPDEDDSGDHFDWGWAAVVAP